MGRCHGALPPGGDCGGYWIAVAVAWPPFCVIWADTWSPTLIAPMLETLPVTLVELVTAAVTVCAGPPIVMDLLLTAVTLPMTKSVPAPAAAARTAITSRRTGWNRRFGGRSSGQPDAVGGATCGPPGTPPSALPSRPPGESSSSGHRSSGQSSLPGPVDPEDR